MGLKLKSKVLGKEFEEKPFFKRVFLNNTYILQYELLKTKKLPDCLQKAFGESSFLFTLLRAFVLRQSSLRYRRPLLRV